MTRNFLTIPAWLLIACFFCSQASAATTVTTSGEVYLANLAPEEAQVLAIKRARYNAIEQVCGVRVQAVIIRFLPPKIGAS